MGRQPKIRKVRIMELVVLPDNEPIIIYPVDGAKLSDCVEAAHAFCREFRIKYVVFVHNDLVYQVGKTGLRTRHGGQANQERRLCNGLGNG